MSNLVKKHYKLLLGLLLILAIPLYSICIEIVFKLGYLVGSAIRTATSCGIW